MIDDEEELQDGLSEEYRYLYSKMNNEGFHYCFKHYSNFEEIKDKRFHELRVNYLKSALELEDYINKKYKESNWF